MQYKKAAVKESDEKLLRLVVAEENGVIDSVKISGDFFIYPEEGVKAIEHSLEGLPMQENVIVEAISIALEENSIEMVGLSAGTIARAIMKAC